MDYNKVLLIGRLTRDVELNQTTTGTECAKFGFATSNGFGEKKKSVFVDITTWGKSAVFVNSYFKKGNEIMIEGRLDFDQWESKEGEKRSKLYVTAERIMFAGGKKEGNNEAQTETKTVETDTDGPIPF